jgi:hemerythrin-like metal-binding protein
LLFGWITSGRPQVLTTLNGILAGLVGITANCDGVTNFEAIIIGAIAGILVILGARLLEKLRLDDVVGAWPVHGLCGIWGGIATGIFTEHALGPQIIGSIAIPAWAFFTMFGLFHALKAAGVLRVSHGEEILGLDMAEHGEVEGGVQFKWRDEFTLHVPEMDKEHKNLVKITEDIIEAMSSGLGKGAIEDAFQGLMDYTVDHFQHEEELIEKHGYPLTAEHKEIHRLLKEKVIAYKDELFLKDSFNAKEFQDFMSGWLVNHILNDDRQYAEFINAKFSEGDSA